MTDHKRRGKRLVAPMNQFPIGDARWLDDMVPELLWIRLLSLQMARKRAVELALHLSRLARSVSGTGPSLRSFAFTSAYSELSALDWERLCSSATDRQQLIELAEAISPLAGLCPRFPLGRLLHSLGVAPKGNLLIIKRALLPLYDRHSTEATMLQAHALYLMFDARLISYEAGSILQEFPEVQFFPTTSKSREVASVVRATLSALVPVLLANRPIEWPTEFWQAAFEAEPCT